MSTGATYLRAPCTLPPRVSLIGRQPLRPGCSCLPKTYPCDSSAAGLHFPHYMTQPLQPMCTGRPATFPTTPYNPPKTQRTDRRATTDTPLYVLMTSCVLDPRLRH